MEGNSKGSKLYVSNGRAFVLDRVRDSDLYLRCRIYKSEQCKGRALLSGLDNVLTITKEHTCPDQSEQLRIMEMKSKMKHLAEVSDESYRDIYEAVAVDPLDRACIEFSDISNAMQKRRKLYR